MKNLLLGLLMLFALSVFAQSTHTINFEISGVGADWAWTMTENADNPPLEFIANPVSGGINTSATVAKFTARAAGNPWALCFTDSDGVFTFDASNSTVKIMVYKPVISNVGIKFEGFSTPVEILIPNTLINQWEELTFNFSASIGNTYSRIVIIPDFAARTVDHIIFLDNIQVPNGVPAGPIPEPTTVPPTPTHSTENVISIYSDSYTNIAGTNFNPNWGQSTIVTLDYVAAGNNTLKYENLNYQGTQYTNQNVSLFQYFHIDFWTPNATNLSFFLISTGPVETPYVLPITQESWVSIDIPLSAFAPVNLADVFQFKVVGNGTVYFDNWYFWKNPLNPGTDATLSDLKVNGTTITGFTSGTLNYNYELPAGSPVPTVTATTNDPLASFVVNNAASLPGTTQVVVTAQDGITSLTYSVNFTLVPIIAAPTPTQNPLNVISMFSNTYTNVSVDTWLTAWSQGVLEDVLIAGNPTKKYSLLNFVGVETTGANLINATEMTHFHIDVWSPDANDFKIKLVDFGADAAYGGGDDTEHELTFPAPATNTWISYDIPLVDFVGLASREHLAQLIMVKAPLGTIYVDNVYYYDADIVKLNLTVILEGPFNGTIMNTFLNSGSLIPFAQPYNTAPWNYTGTESVAGIENANVVDWVLVELRDATTAASATTATRIARQAAFLLNDGSIVSTDGSSDLLFNVTITSNLFAIVWYKNHLGVMSAVPLTLVEGLYSYDFSSSSTQAYGTNSQKQLVTGKWGMYSGDGDANNTVNVTDKTTGWSPNAGKKGYLSADFNRNGQVNNIDKNNYWLPNISKSCQVPQ